MDTREITQKLGLSSKEASVYAACLEYGPLRAKDISDQTNVNRGTVYDIAKALFKKGLFSTTQKKRVTYFLANSPEAYLKKLEDQVKLVKQAVPEIDNIIKNSTYRPTLRFYEGREGIQAMYEEQLNCKNKNLLYFASSKDIFGSVGIDFMRYYTHKRARRHIVTKGINDPNGEVDDKEVHHSTHTDAKLLRTVKIGSPDVSFPGMMMIYDNKVAFASTKKENFGFVLESEDFTHMMKQYFEVLWGMSTDDQEYYSKKTNK